MQRRRPGAHHLHLLVRDRWRHDRRPSDLGAGAHLITAQLLTSAGFEGPDFVGWALLGLPLALVSSHLAAELVRAARG